jgi:DNA-binding NtrC family response regulator
LPINVPSLRDRDDIEFLARQLLTRIGERLGSETRDLSRKQLASLGAHGWPGNVRELENVLTRFIVTGQLPVLTAHALPKPEAENVSGLLKERIRSQTAAEIRAALERSGGNKRQAAGLLGISRGHLYRLMKEQASDPNQARD